MRVPKVHETLGLTVNLKEELEYGVSKSEILNRHPVLLTNYVQFIFKLLAGRK